MISLMERILVNCRLLGRELLSRKLHSQSLSKKSAAFGVVGTVVIIIGICGISVFGLLHSATATQKRTTSVPLYSDSTLPHDSNASLRNKKHLLSDVTQGANTEANPDANAKVNASEGADVSEPNVIHLFQPLPNMEKIKGMGAIENIKIPPYDYQKLTLASSATSATSATSTKFSIYPISPMPTPTHLAATHSNVETGEASELGVGRNQHSRASDHALLATSAPIAIPIVIHVSDSSPKARRSMDSTDEEVQRNAYTQFRVANAQANQGQWQTAQDGYLRAYKLDPHNPIYIFNLAISAEHLNQWTLAKNYYRQSILLADSTQEFALLKQHASARINQLENSNESTY